VSELLHVGFSEAVGRPKEFITDMLIPHTDGVLRCLCYHLGHPQTAPHKDLGMTTLLQVDALGLEFQPRGREEWLAAAEPRACCS